MNFRTHQKSEPGAVHSHNVNSARENAPAAQKHTRTHAHTPTHIHTCSDRLLNCRNRITVHECMHKSSAHGHLSRLSTTVMLTGVCQG